MKTRATNIIILALMLSTTLCCTNMNNKTETVITQTDVLISTDTSIITNLKIQTDNSIIDKKWYFYIINGNSIEQYITESIPYMIISNDSSYIYMDSGCNIYIGECEIKSNDKIAFKRIRIKDEICLIDALEREIVYMLDRTDHYRMNNNTLLLHNNNNTIGFLTTDDYIK